MEDAYAIFGIAALAFAVLTPICALFGWQNYLEYKYCSEKQARKEKDKRDA